MRKSPELDSLLPQTRQQVLAATLLQPERWWYLSELAKFLHLTPSTLQREVRQLSKVGILEQRSDAHRTYYRCNKQSPVVEDMQNLLIKTIGAVGLLRHGLKQFFSQIEVAFIFGSFAQSRELATSDIDLMLVGSIGLADIAPLLGKLETRIGRAINPVIMSVNEAREKLETSHPFLDSISTASKIFLKGEDSELGKAFNR